jgi:hypothetical protein
MRTGDALLLIGGAGALWLLTKQSAAKRLVFFPGAIQGMAFEGATPMAYLDVIVQNTSNADIAVYSIAGTAYANGYMIGNISNFQGVTIRRNSESRLPVTVRFNLIGMVNDIINAFQTKTFKQDIIIQGTANAEGFPVPIDLKFSVG